MVSDEAGTVMFYLGNAFSAPASRAESKLIAMAASRSAINFETPRNPCLPIPARKTIGMAEGDRDDSKVHD